MKATYQQCVPSGGQWPGELHEACHSYIDHATRRVVVLVRHLATGDCSVVPAEQVQFEGQALAKLMEAR